VAWATVAVSVMGFHTHSGMFGIRTGHAIAAEAWAPDSNRSSFPENRSRSPERPGWPAGSAGEAANG
jgi:hypothetical protein